VTTKRISEKQIDTLITKLRNLAYNLWWSWNPDAQQIFHELSPFFWEHSNNNPIEVMNWIKGPELRARLQNHKFFNKVNHACKAFNTYMAEKNTWAKKHASHLRLPVAYFSAEFGLHESLRIYSGGLGTLAGDHVKSTGSLGVPFVGVGLFYRKGYFKQVISEDGWQQESYLTYDPAKLPMTLLIDRKGNPIICSVEIGNSLVQLKAWVVNVGRTQIYLLDTNLPQNDEQFLNLTDQVYGGDYWTRIAQEIVLGIGGVRLLNTLRIVPSVYHMNEGHSAFLALELLRSYLQSKKTLQQAEASVKQRCIFTTHTPVSTGHDRFDQGLIEAALPRFASSLGMTIDQLMRYGKVRPDDGSEPFCMTVLALRMSRDANGVSELHRDVSRGMWKDLYPGVAIEKIPIGHITNGVNTIGWTSQSAFQFWTWQLGHNWVNRLRDHKFWQQVLSVKKISDEELWALRTTLRRELVEFARERLQQQQLRLNADDVSLFDNVLSQEALTIGFARRFATYKRAPLFFRDLEWAVRTLTNKDRPVQIIFAGKAHPKNDDGKRFIQEIVNLAKRVDLFGRVVFIEDHDMNVAQYLVAGADVWLNTPRRPTEASGTSGMKVTIHGGLNMSIMDGWWREAYDGHNGWKIGEDISNSDERAQDDLDAVSLRSVMENEIIPLFYDRGRDGIPHRWLNMVRHSIATLIPVYNTDRMVEEYTQKYYRHKTNHVRRRSRGVR
jgi:starch phosphorylase